MPRLTTAQRSEIETALRQGRGIRELARAFGLSPSSVSNIAKRLREQKDPHTASVMTGFRMTAREHEAFVKAFEQSGSRTHSDFLRGIVRAHLGFFEPDDEAASVLRGLEAELGRIGQNVNQVAREMSARRVMGEQPELTRDRYGMMLELREALRRQRVALSRMLGRSQERTERMRRFFADQADGRGDA